MSANEQIMIPASELVHEYVIKSKIEELEKIKAEINSEDVNCRYDEYEYSSGLQKAIELINKHISELKGETE